MVDFEDILSMFFHALFNGKAWSTMELHVLNMELHVLNQGIVSKQNKTWSTMYFHEMSLNISRDDGESPDGTLSLSVSKCGREIWLMGGCEFLFQEHFHTCLSWEILPLKSLIPTKIKSLRRGGPKF